MSDPFSFLAGKELAIAVWIADSRQRFGGQQVAVCLEQWRGALIYVLMQYEFLVLFPINPKQFSDYRTALYPSGAKSDPNDAELLARFLREQRDKLRAWHPEDAITRGLRLMSEQRRKWVQDRVAQTNALRQRLKDSDRLALDFCDGDLWSESFLSQLGRFPSQRKLQRASPKQLEKWLPKKHRKAGDPSAEELLRERIATVRKVKPLTSDRAILEHARLAVVNLVVMIRALNRAITETEAKIASLFAEHPDAPIFSSFPGAGEALAPRLAAAYGTDRDKYQGAEDMQRLSGIAPVTRASGKMSSVQMRWACPKFLRQTFHEFAQASVRYSRWTKAYVAMRKAAGHHHHEIIRSLAFKWQRILTRCWKNRQPYDELRYIECLRQTSFNLIAYLPPQPDPTS
ncbi:MAG TPA: transposase [Pirellulales bacterium]|nr:transposase [Pirellulales bacterium]